MKEPLKLVDKLRQHAQGLQVQIFDSDKIAGLNHLFFASLNAIKAFQSSRNLSKSIAGEIAIYASGQRQIQTAIRMIGVAKDTQAITVVAVDTDSLKISGYLSSIIKLMSEDVRVSQIQPRSANQLAKIRSTFQITDEELESIIREGMSLSEAIEWAVVERMAVLSCRL